VSLVAAKESGIQDFYTKERVFQIAGDDYFKTTRYSGFGNFKNTTKVLP